MIPSMAKSMLILLFVFSFLNSVAADETKVVDALIWQGAGVSILNAEMLTAADVAFINDHKELAEKLEMLGGESESEYEVLMNLVGED